ncbi:centromere protein P isoform X3 [Equus asinus]|uniref:centromere protein P isoform X3 n=1 Tax=Equus asinus TaxID=9793 RepID=UPI0038F6142C
MDARRVELSALQAEIAALRRACEETPAPAEDATRGQKSFQEIYQSDSEGWESSKDLRSHLGHLESEILFLSTLTGIKIRNYSKKTKDLTSTEMTEKSIKKVLQRHRLSGNCHMITFQLEFQILEIQNKKSLSSVITDLNIIMEPTEYSELSEFVSSLDYCLPPLRSEPVFVLGAEVCFLEATNCWILFCNPFCHFVCFYWRVQSFYIEEQKKEEICSCFFEAYAFLWSGVNIVSARLNISRKSGKQRQGEKTSVCRLERQSWKPGRGA